jgi:hypothetical protein
MEFQELHAGRVVFVAVECSGIGSL